MNFNDPMLTIIRKLEALEVEQKRLASLRPLYGMLNVALEVQIAADQSDYAVGDYDILFIEPTGVDRTIHGLTNGVPGRHLYIFNSSSLLNLLFSHQSATASANNRMASPNAGTITLPARKLAQFVYINDANVVGGVTRWMMLLPWS